MNKCNFYTKHIKLLCVFCAKYLNMLGIGLGSAALGIAGNIWANSQATKAQNQFDDYLNKSLEDQKTTLKGREMDLEQTYNRRYNQDYLDTETARALQKRFSTYSKDILDSIRSQSVAAGATPEAVVAQQKTVGDQYNDLLGNLASQSTAYKQNLQNSRDMQKMGMWGMEDNLKLREDQIKSNQLGQRIQSAQNLGNNISNATGGIMNAWAEGAFGDWKK